MKFTLYTLLAVLSFYLLPSACAGPTQNPEPPAKEAIVKEYQAAMDWLIKQSNDYSGVLNPRQTWSISYEGYQVKEEYFWDGETTIITEFDIRNISKAKIEERFTNSVALYPKEGKTEFFKVQRFEEGESQEIESEYYNWMVFPKMKGEALERLETVLELVKDED